MIVIYDEENNITGVEPHEDNDEFVEVIKQLNKSVKKLNENIEKQNLREEETEKEEEEKKEEETEEPEPSEMEKQIENIDKQLTEINDREKEREKQQQLAAEEENKKALENSKSASVDLWTGVVYKSNSTVNVNSQTSEVTFPSSQDYDVYKLSLPANQNYTFHFKYNGGISQLKLIYMDSNDNYIAYKNVIYTEETDIIGNSQNVNFSTPSNTSYVLFSVRKTYTELKLYSDTVGRESIIYYDSSADTHLYLTTEVENASLNDIFTMTLSIRNIIVLAFLLFLSLTFFKLIRTCLERMLNR